MDAGPHLDERADLALGVDPAGVRVHDAGDDLEQRRLAGAVGADEADRLARLDLERDVAQHPAPRVARGLAPPEHVVGPGEVVAQEPPAPVHPEPLPDVLDGDGSFRLTSAKPVSSRLKNMNEPASQMQAMTAAMSV